MGPSPSGLPDAAGLKVPLHDILQRTRAAALAPSRQSQVPGIKPLLVRYN